jgi:hypothetical protein
MKARATIRPEFARQQDTLELTASENFAPVAVMEAQRSVLTNTYAEGYPGHLYDGGCEHVRPRGSGLRRADDRAVSSCSRACPGPSVVSGPVA